MKKVEFINSITINGKNVAGFVTLRGRYHTELIAVDSYENYILMTVDEFCSALPHETVLLWDIRVDGVPTSTQLYRKAVRWIKENFSYDAWVIANALSAWDD